MTGTERLAQALAGGGGVVLREEPCDGAYFHCSGTYVCEHFSCTPGLSGDFVCKNDFTCTDYFFCEGDPIGDGFHCQVAFECQNEVYIGDC